MSLILYEEKFMQTKIKDLTVGELQSLILDTIKNTLDDLIEGMLALSSDKYLQSIEEVRKDYKEGRIKFLEDIIKDCS